MPRGSVILTALALGLMAAPSAQADMSLGTVHGVTYVTDSSAPVGSSTTGGSPAILAHCPSGTELLGGGVRMNYNDTGAVLHSIYPTTTEGSEGSLGFDFFNNSGSALTGTVVASCNGVGNPAYQGQSGDLGSVGAILSLTATCPESRHVTGGGIFVSTAQHESNISRSFPVDDGDSGKEPDDGWSAKVWDRQGPGASATAYAICTKRPHVSYRSKRVTLAADSSPQPFVSCRQDQAALSAGVRLPGPVDHSALTSLDIYDGGDDDLAPDDGAQARLTNILDPRRARVYAICKG